MKLRFRGNTLRLRVNRREVDALALGSPLREHVSFPGHSQFSYVLEPFTRETATASFVEGVVHISAPLSQVKPWASGDAIGLYFDLPANGANLKIAIEKDLECVDGPIDERDQEAFPRPAGRSC